MSNNQHDSDIKILPKPVQQTIKDSVLCWLATVGGEGQPNVTPKQIFTTDGVHILVANIASPNTVANIGTHDKVCISFIDIFAMRGFKVYGVARYITPSEEGYNLWHAPLYAMAGDDFPILGIVIITPNQISPIVAPSYRLFPDRPLAERIAREMAAYGVKPA